MNEQPSTPELELSAEELRHLLRPGDPPFTRRELRMRDRAEEAGLLVRVDGELQVASAQEPEASVPEPPAPFAPPVTPAPAPSAVVPATSGMTRRQLRELAAKESAEKEQVSDVDTGDLERTVEAVVAPPARVSTRDVAEQLGERVQPAPERPVEQTARRPVVRPQGAVTGEYTGEFDQIRKAMADINAAPDTAAVTPPARRSIFDARIPEELTQQTPVPEAEAQQTDAADVSTLMDMPVVTDDVFPDEILAEPAVAHTEPDPEPAPSKPQQPASGSALPEWHTITGSGHPAAVEPPQRQSHTSAPSREAAPARREGSLLLTILQWIVIVVVAIVLGLLVWYAINRGFGEENPDAMGIFFPLYHLRI